MNRYITIMVLLLLFGIGVGVRLAVLHAQYTAWGPELPFTLESAIQYRMVETVYTTGRLPSRDMGVEYPDGVVMAETYTLGSEWFYAGLARMLPRSMSLSYRVRLSSVLLFCLTIPLLAAWVGVMFRSKAGGVVAGLFTAFPAAAVIRSTGQELSRENFALPWLALFLLLWTLGLRCGKEKRLWVYQIGAGFSLAMALMNWDMIQFALGLWVLGGYVQFIRSDRSDPHRISFSLVTAALLLAGLLNPYLRNHGFPLSPILFFALGIAAVSWLPLSGLKRGFPTGCRIGIPILCMVTALWIGRAYAGNYHHFAELLQAKIAFGNVKPADPSLLTFEQRIMWVPALHSATWRISKTLFPVSLILALCSAGFVLAVKPRTAGSRYYFLLGCFLLTLITYVFFVRFHVYLALLAAVLIGGWVAEAQRVGQKAFWIALVLVVVGLLVEGGNTLHEPQHRWGRPNVYYRYQQELVDWLAKYGDQQPVLANFGISGSILAYAGCPVILHPKFETVRIRNRVKAYAEHLFKHTEKEFRDWAEQYGTKFYIYARGEFASIHPEYQMRYMVDALTPPADAAVWVFKERPGQARYFHYMWGNTKYGVFRIITREDEVLSEDYTALALQAFRHGDLDNALKRTLMAMEFNPKNSEAVEILARVKSLKSDGVDNLWQDHHEETP